MKRLTEIVRGLLALLVVIVIVVGSPFALMRVGRIDALLALVERGTFAGYGGEALLGVITLVAWLAWVLATLSILVESIAAVSGQRLRLPGTGVFAPASAVLVTAILGLAASGGASNPAEHSHDWRAEQLAMVSHAARADDARLGEPDASESRRERAAALRSADQLRVHIVKPGEDLWTLAERFLDDGSRWRELAEMNDTTLLSPTEMLRDGMQLYVPIEQADLKATGGPSDASNETAQTDFEAAASMANSRDSATAGGSSAGGVGAVSDDLAGFKFTEERNTEPGLSSQLDQAATRQIIVQAGDSLWSIAEREFGDGTAWRQILDLNRDQISEPDQIDVGWTLNLPALQTADAEHDATHIEPLAAERSIEAHDAQRLDDNSRDEPVGDDTVTHRGQVEHQTDSQRVDSVEDSVDDDQAPVGESDEQLMPNVDSVLSNVTAIAGISITLAATLAAALRLRRGRQLAQLPLGSRLRLAREPHDAVAAGLLALADQDEILGSAGRRRSLDQTACALRVRLGELSADEQPVWLDLAVAKRVTFCGDLEECVGLATAVILQLIGEADGTQVFAGGRSFDWLASLDEPRVDISTLAQTRQRLVDVVGERQAALLGEESVHELQADPATAAAWSPCLFVFDADPGLPELDPDELGRCGIAVLSCTSDGEAASSGTATVKVHTLQALLPDGTEFVPDHVSKPARRALAELFDEANQQDFEAANWWASEPLIAGNVIPFAPHQIQAPAPWQGAVNSQRLEFPLPITQYAQTSTTKAADPVTEQAGPAEAHPFLRMLGPVTLVNTRGEPPQRAAKQCAEYCAWLLENPGASAPAMARSLLVAESTRRSNMSRLRSWLGADHDGVPYLPEAYSGRIFLHPAISSDWERFGLLLGAGVDRASDEALTRALELVRGAPLADAAPGQWHWAEQLRADMAAMVRDVAYLLASRKLAAGDFDQARWAANRGLLASPEDEQLLGVKLLIEHRCGNRLEVDRLVLHITRQARILGVDLMDETVTLLQEVVEGQARSRMA